MKSKYIPTILFTFLLTTVVVIGQQVATFEISAEKLQKHVSYLASDKLTGRRTGTQGATDAAKYIAAEFGRLELRAAGPKAKSWRPGTAIAWFQQSFPYVAGVELGKNNQLRITTEPATEHPPLRLSEDWLPLGFTSNEKVAGPLGFVGFGITAAEHNYDDYNTFTAKGWIAIALSGTPDGDNPHGKFQKYEDVRWKAIAARNAGAKALIVVSRENNFKDERLAKLRFDNSGGNAGLPVAVVSREAFARLFGKEAFASFETEAMKGSREPRGHFLGNVEIATEVVRKEAPAYNVIGVLEGSDPVLKNETIIIGAHYDHLGTGGAGSLAANSSEIHHGADDNASGTAGLLELARVLSTQRPRPKRTIVFMAFSGEEEGLLGSNYYVNNPLTPLANTVAMINMDMIGRMKDRKLIIGGVGTAKEWREIIAKQNDPNNSAPSLSMTATTSSSTQPVMPVAAAVNTGPTVNASSEKRFDITFQEDGYGPSDHSSFYSKQIPVLFFWTGTHNDYHKPSDTFDKINYEDEARILSLVARIVRALDKAEKRPTYTVAKSDAPAGRSTGFRVYLGTIPNYSDSNDGMLVDGVRDDSPASKAGIKAGDKIVKIGTRDIKNVYDYTYALGEMKAGEEYVIEVMRGGEKLSLKIKPEARK